MTAKFFGRGREISQIERSLLAKASDQSRRRIFVLHGLGGIGKTQLAIEYARRHTEDYTAVFWLDGGSKYLLAQSFVQVAGRIPKDQISADVIAVLQSPTSHVDIIMKEVLRWLALRDNRHWLLIIDNVDREYRGDDKDENAFHLRDVVPVADHGSVLITTRLANTKNLGDGLQLAHVSDDEAKAMLEHHAGRCLKDIGPVIKELHGLPLALTQAGAYMGQTGIDVLTYIKYYESTWSNLVRKQDRFPLQEYAERSMLTTWTISYEQVLRQSEDAAALMRLWGYFYHDDLWYDLIASAVELDNITERPVWLTRVAESELEFADAVGVLRAYSLVDKRYETAGYSMHSVLHRWCQGLCVEREKQLFLILSASMTAAIVPSKETFDYWEVDRRLILHVMHVWAKLMKPSGGTAHSPPEWVFHNMGLLLARQGKLKEAKEVYERALAGREKALGSDHTSTLETVHNLGVLYWKQGKLREAERMFERALAGCEKALGSDHTSTLDTVNNLGVLYTDQGKLEEAERMHERALAGCEKALGSDHTSTLGAVHNLGVLYRNQGKLGEAERMYERALAGREKALGSDHTSTLETVHNLGVLYRNQGKLREAERMYERALVGCEKALGSDHTSTLETVNNLGVIYIDQGKLEEAERMHERALVGCEKALGSDHTSTLDTVHNLGVLYWNQGKYEEAERMFERASASGSSLD